VTAAPIPRRLARLVLVTPDGRAVGALPPFPVETPWWQDAEPLVDGARKHHAIEVTILRMLEADLEVPPGGTVTYLAEVAHPVSASPWHGALDDHPLRMTWARPGGPAVRGERPGLEVAAESLFGRASRLFNASWGEVTRSCKWNRHARSP